MQDIKPPYQGPERRRRRVYVTRNTEYHFLDELCIAEKSRLTDKWRLGNAALRHALSGCVRFAADGEVQPNARAPAVGDALFFADPGCDIITSALVAIERPAREIVATYPA